MGTSVHEGQWSIVGGTADLAMARGVIEKKLHEKKNGGDIIELTIHGFCHMQVRMEAYSHFCVSIDYFHVY